MQSTKTHGVEDLLITGAPAATVEGYQRDPFAGKRIDQTGRTQAAARDALSEGITVPLESSNVDA